MYEEYTFNHNIPITICFPHYCLPTIRDYVMGLQITKVCIRVDLNLVDAYLYNVKQTIV